MGLFVLYTSNFFDVNVKQLAMVLVYSSGGVGVNKVRLRLQSYSVKLLAWSLSIPVGGWGEQSPVKVAKLQCKAAGMVLVYSSGRDWESQTFWSKTVFSAQTTFTTFITGPLSYRTGNNSLPCRH